LQLRGQEADTEAPMTAKTERRATRREKPPDLKPRYVRENRVRRPFYWLSGR